MDEMKIYRKLLQKVARMKTKILFALKEEGCREAADMLQAPPREIGSNSMQQLPGMHCPSNTRRMWKLSGL